MNTPLSRNNSNQRSEKKFLPSEFKIIVKTLAGLEDLLLDEVVKLGGLQPEKLNRAVKCTGDLSVVYRLNYLSRLALKVLIPIYTFDAHDELEFYNGVKSFDWTKVFRVDQTFAIDGFINQGFTSHSQYIALKAKDAIVDRFRASYNRRPDVDPTDPDIQLNVHVFKDNCSISLDSSGESLHKRGYRIKTGLAPINEVLAAGLIQLAGWDKITPFYDPMCGSGTILIEAAMLAMDRPAGFYRHRFCFENWVDHDPALWRQIKSEAMRNESAPQTQIVGSDIAPQSISSARQNILNAGLGSKIRLAIKDISEFIPQFTPGTVIMNPPYGERIQTDDIIALYKKIGDALKNNFTGFSAWALSSDSYALKFIGLHPSRKITVFNGPLECRFIKYDVYEGSKKYSEEVSDAIE